MGWSRKWPSGSSAKVAKQRRAIAHLYRRAGFGARPEEMDAALSEGYERTRERLLDFRAPDPAADAVVAPAVARLPDPLPANAEERRAVQNKALLETRQVVLWWLDRMVVAQSPLREKLTWFWHGHFATGYSKVRDPNLLLRQNQLLRTMGTGNFEALTQAVAKDPAMMIWLDSTSNQKGRPNENFSRELMELFALGIGNFNEVDVTEGARAFTGWTYNRAAHAFLIVPELHDDGIKTVLNVTGPLTGEDVVHTVTRAPAASRFVVAQLWSHLVYPVAPNDRVVDELAPAFAANLDIGKLVAAVFRHPAFQSDEARSGLVKQPVEHLVGTLRALNRRADDLAMLDGIRELGQMPLDPPNVGGWPQNGYWLGTAASLARLKQADFLSQQADISSIEGLPLYDRVPAVARMLSVPAWTGRTAAALEKVAHEPRTLLAGALVAPEYLMN